jgi:acyl-coenzyme A thioesterase PaaI-like protein
MNDHIPDFDGRRALTDEARRLLRAIRLTHVGDDDRTKVAELLAEATALLERDAPDEPLWHTGLTDFEGYDATIGLNRIFPFSPATGGVNPAAPSVDVAVDDDGVIRGEVTFAEIHNGPPFDLVHGGVVALVYDELLGMAGMVGGGGGFTANLTVEYRLPTPIGVPLQIAAWMTEPDGRKLYGHGEMRHEGTLLTEARGLFIQPLGMGQPDVPSS